MPDALAKQVCPIANGCWHKGLQDITSFGAHDGISTGSFSGPTGMQILGGHRPTRKQKCVNGFSNLEDDHSSEDAEEPNRPVVVGIEDFPRLDCGQIMFATVRSFDVVTCNKYISPFN